VGLFCSQALGNQEPVKRTVELAKTTEKFVSYVPERNIQEAET